MEKIIIGTRGSAMALKQTETIKNKLLTINPKLIVEIKVIITKGDINKNPIPLDTVGKGWFTKELDRSLLNEEIDIAAHSLKDIPEDLPHGLTIAAIPEREDAREALISKHGLTFPELRDGAIVGTDSNRRKAQLLYMRPDLTIKSIRGNADTRLAKLYAQDYDALVLAAAGLKRLGLEKKISQYFFWIDFVPAPGQGALAVIVKKNQKIIRELVKQINDQETSQAVTAERAFSAAVGGGCKTPVGAYAFCDQGKLMMYGMVGSLDGKHIVKDFIEGAVGDAVNLGEQLAVKILKTAKPWYEANK